MKGAVVVSSTVVAVGAVSLLSVLALLGLQPEPALPRGFFGKPKHMEAAGRAAPADVPVVRDAHLASDAPGPRKTAGPHIAGLHPEPALPRESFGKPKHTEAAGSAAPADVPVVRDTHLASDAPGLRKAAGPRIATCCPDTAPQPTGWEAACANGTQPFSPPSPADRPEMFTIVVTTYKGHATLSNTIGSWKRTGLLNHPRLEEVVFHCNMCSCADLELVENLMNGTAYRVVCAEANRLHPQALLFALRAVVTPLVLLTENDRPVVQRVNETLAEAAVRVGRFLDLSLETVANESTPYVFLGAASDDALFSTLEERARRNATVGGPLTCFRQSTWSNGPALFRVSWYLDTIVRRMCQFPDQAGLRFRSRSPHFGWYGRQMEYFLSRVFAKEQYPMCCGDGIMDHIEIESFDGDSVTR
ncbi:hypothetical protein DIPPA_27949 [Diplonema papillatum]|nr:hypothetical protein DIPPA_27949 [Diplonema papillatum]